MERLTFALLHQRSWIDVGGGKNGLDDVLIPAMAMRALTSKPRFETHRLGTYITAQARLETSHLCAF